MTVTIYIWYPLDILNLKSSAFNALTARDVGHVSMLVKNTYISHRPLQEQDNLIESSDSITLKKQEYLFQYLSTQMDLNVDANTIKKNLRSILEKLNIEDIEESTNLENIFKTRISRESRNKDYTRNYILLDSVPSANSLNYNYNLECQRKKREADKIYEIKGLDEDKLLEYYNSSKTTEYHPLFNNCSTFIANVIRSSLNCPSECSQFCSFCVKRYVLVSSELRESNNLSNNISTNLKQINLYLILFSILLIPVSVYSTGVLIYNLEVLFAEELIISIIFIATILGIANSTLQNIPVWTPSLIKKFIKKIKDNQEQINVCLKHRKSRWFF